MVLPVHAGIADALPPTMIVEAAAGRVDILVVNLVARWRPLRRRRRATSSGWRCRQAGASDHALRTGRAAPDVRTSRRQDHRRGAQNVYVLGVGADVGRVTARS